MHALLAFNLVCSVHIYPYIYIYIYIYDIRTCCYMLTFMTHSVFLYLSLFGILTIPATCLHLLHLMIDHPLSWVKRQCQSPVPYLSSCLSCVVCYCSTHYPPHLESEITFYCILSKFVAFAFLYDWLVWSPFSCHGFYPIWMTLLILLQIPGQKRGRSDGKNQKTS